MTSIELLQVLSKVFLRDFLTLRSGNLPQDQLDSAHLSAGIQIEMISQVLKLPHDATTKLLMDALTSVVNSHPELLALYGSPTLNPAPFLAPYAAAVVQLQHSI